MVLKGYSLQHQVAHQAVPSSIVHKEVVNTCDVVLEILTQNMMEDYCVIDDSVIIVTKGNTIIKVLLIIQLLNIKTKDIQVFLLFLCPSWPPLFCICLL